MSYLCADFGSTWTKLSLISDCGEYVAGATHPTTIATDVMDGFVSALDSLSRHEPSARSAEVMACSSAGGGLRIAVVGNEALVTSEAGRRVALSSGGHVVAVLSGGLTRHDLPQLTAARPDMVMLVGGTDGGNPTTLLESATVLGESGLSVPVVVAGNAAAADEASRLLGEVPHVVAANVVPEIGVFTPASARGLAREMFLTHVIGGKGLSASTEFARMVVGATPDVVLRGAELVSTHHGDIVVVDVGGATTDVHSVVEVLHPEPREDETGPVLASDVVAATPATRTVEGDLGMRWSAATTLAASQAEGFGTPAANLSAWVDGLTPDRLPADDTERGWDARLAHLAIATALRRHAGHSEVRWVNGQRIIEQTGTDIREARWLIGSGGVLRANPTRGAAMVADALEAAHTPGRMLPARAAITIDDRYLLAPIGLLADAHPEAATQLTHQLILKK